MRNFKLYIKHQNNTKLITDFDQENLNNNLNYFGTFNEKLTIAENDQFNLSFQVAAYIKYDSTLTKNYWTDLLKIKTKLLLTLDDEETYIYLVINNITPKITKNNLIYEYQAQDEVSYSWAKHRLGYSYSNLETGVKNIYDISKEVLRDNFLDRSWEVVDTEAEILPNNLLPLRSKFITLNVENSNPYNVIIEACNTLGCYMKINYKKYQISFYQKEAIPFSGYRYRPDFNLSNMNIDYNGTEFSSILHVTGGTNEYGEIITMVPAIPIAIQSALLETYNWKYFIWKDLTWIDSDWFDDIEIDEDSIWPERNIWKDVDWDLLLQDYYISKKYDDDGKETEQFKQEKLEIQEFLNIAINNQHIGQFMYNFYYFIQSNLISSKDYEELTRIIDFKMRNNNIMLKIYTPMKYKTEFSIQSILNSIYTEGTFYINEYRIQQQSKPGEYNEEDRAKIRKKIINLCKGNDYELFKNWALLYGNKTSIEEYPDIISWRDKEKYYITQKEYTQNNITNLNEQLEKIIEEKNPMLHMELTSQLELMKQKLITYENLGTGWTFEYNGESIEAPNVYSFIIEILSEEFKNYIPKNNTENINEIIAKYTARNNELWFQLYGKYEQYLYEAQYENTDELDSTSLYNQGLTYFLEQNHPIPSYSFEILDIERLEAISIPRLTVGSKIRIYNNLLSLADDEKDIISYSNNEVVVTSIDYDLRSSLKYSIQVATTQTYKSMLEKMLLSIKK